MTDTELFTLVGTRELPPREAPKRHRLDGFPWVSLAVLAAIILGCLACDLLMTHDPTIWTWLIAAKRPTAPFTLAPMPWDGISFPASGTADASP